VSVEGFERQVAISGVGKSQIGRGLPDTGLQLTIEASRAAVMDAGLSFDDIDGLASYPSVHPSPGFAGAGVYDLKEALGLRLHWVEGSPHTAGQFGPVVNAAMAVASGVADHVLCFRTMTEASAQRGGGRSAVTSQSRPALNQFSEFLVPFGAASAATWVAMYASRYMHEYGMTRSQLAGIALASRRHAGRNPEALFRDPMTLDDYLAARMIADPLCLFDCDAPVDGSVALVISRRKEVPDPKRAVGIEATGVAMEVTNHWDQAPDLETTALDGAAERLWSRSRFSPRDVDVALLYDGFSFLALMWLEALGLCARGEGADFVSDPARLDLGGQLPMNTQGGHLSAGRLHGYGMAHEAVLQLRGEATGRQVRSAHVAVATAGGGPLAGCMILTSPGTSSR
jgi:acetyl-CoA acetyltransferase